MSEGVEIQEREKLIRQRETKAGATKREKREREQEVMKEEDGGGTTSARFSLEKRGEFWDNERRGEWREKGRG